MRYHEKGLTYMELELGLYRGFLKNKKFKNIHIRCEANRSDQKRGYNSGA
jgi:hypothetical protein